MSTILDDSPWWRVWLDDRPSHIYRREVAEQMLDIYRREGWMEARMEPAPDPYTLPHGTDGHRCSDPENPDEPSLCRAYVRALGEAHYAMAHAPHTAAHCPGEGVCEAGHKLPKGDPIDEFRGSD